MSNNGFTQRGVRYVLDDDALNSKMQEVALSDDEDIDLSTVGDDTLIAVTGTLLKTGIDIRSDNALCTELIRRSGCYVMQMLIDEGIVKAQVQSDDG